jgi:hypothetical protein
MMTPAFDHLLYFDLVRFVKKVRKLINHTDLCTVVLVNESGVNVTKENKRGR